MISFQISDYIWTLFLPGARGVFDQSKKYHQFLPIVSDKESLFENSPNKDLSFCFFFPLPEKGTTTSSSLAQNFTKFIHDFGS
ncbi:hypothetical protein L2E82_05513 [Cichorium intybus]|uniref:Uncharacterized protein n=1 Tax=Cichorium intybus TaxID=13427 RepID=A0ACB9H895_CICIN|nr:hypothetical protein L2E82_05513 [Cichorium intybus]